MRSYLTYKYLFFASFTALLVFLILAPTFGGPGETDDPVVSLSYLQLANRYEEIPLKKNDQYPIEKGVTFILIDGKAELQGVGDYLAVNLTAGKTSKRAKEIYPNHLNMVIRGSDIKIIAKSDCTICVQAANGGPLRKAF